MEFTEPKSNMEEETESVTEAKTLPTKKKIDVLGAMAKYHLKKQQEQEEKMNDSKPKNLEAQHQKQDTSVTKNSSKWKDRKDFHHNKFNKNDRQSAGGQKRNFGTQPQQQKPKEHPQKESLIGITEFVNQDNGFSAILKQRYSDFHVHEIDIDGTIVHLTDQSIPCPPGDPNLIVNPTDKELATLTEEQWKSVEEAMTSETPITVEIDVTEKTKEERLVIHKVLRAKFKGVISNSVPVEGRTIMKIFKGTGKRGENRKTGPSYTKFVLYKENLSTMEAVSTIGRVIRMKSSFFATAGTKDKRGITTQMVTVRNVEPLKLLNSVRNNSKIAVGNFSYSERPLELGQLKGNRFIIALRNVIGDENKITANIESLKKNGFINYYGAQRFGTRHVPTHHVGKQLLHSNWQKAIDLILQPPEMTGGFLRDFDLVLACQEYLKTKNAHQAFSKVKRSINTVEAQLLFNLKKHGKDLVGALNTIPRNLRLTYIHAYQSFLWNTVVSRRLAKYGFSPILGDLVYAPGVEHDVEPDTENENDEIHEKEETEEEASAESKNESSNKRAQRNARPVIALDESNISNYTIHDVLLPLPGFDITYPSNEVANWYTELLVVDGLTEMDFKQSVKSYNLGGAYRLVMSKPQDVQWKFVRYDDPSLSLIPSDWDRLENTPLPPSAVEGGAFLALVLEFSLPASSYATMALREITKMDMSAEFQTSLNEAGTCKQPTTGDTTDGEPDSKRIKQEPSPTKEESVC